MTDDPIKLVRRVARKRERSYFQWRSDTDELRAACALAKDAGVPISQIAREAGLSRQGVYDLLAAPPPS